MSECHQVYTVLLVMYVCTDVCTQHSLTKNEAQRGFRIGPCSWTYRRTKNTEKLEQYKHTARSYPKCAWTTPQTRGFTSSILETDF